MCYTPYVLPHPEDSAMMGFFRTAKLLMQAIMPVADNCVRS